MSQLKPIVFVSPLDPETEELKEYYKENAEELGVEVIESDSINECALYLASVGQSVLITGHGKRCAQLLQKSKKIIKSKKSKVILLSEKAYPQKTIVKLMKLGLSEFIQQPVPQRTLQYKVDLLLRSITVAKESDDNAEKIEEDVDELNDKAKNNPFLRKRKNPQKSSFDFNFTDEKESTSEQKDDDPEVFEKEESNFSLQDRRKEHEKKEQGQTTDDFVDEEDSKTKSAQTEDYFDAKDPLKESYTDDYHEEDEDSSAEDSKSEDFVENKEPVGEGSASDYHEEAEDSNSDSNKEHKLESGMNTFSFASKQDESKDHSTDNAFDDINQQFIQDSSANENTLEETEEKQNKLESGMNNFSFGEDLANELGAMLDQAPEDSPELECEQKNEEDSPELEHSEKSEEDSPELECEQKNEDNSPELEHSEQGKEDSPELEYAENNSDNVVPFPDQQNAGSSFHQEIAQTQKKDICEIFNGPEEIEEKIDDRETQIAVGKILLLEDSSINNKTPSFIFLCEYLALKSKISLLMLAGKSSIVEYNALLGKRYNCAIVSDGGRPFTFNDQFINIKSESKFTEAECQEITLLLQLHRGSLQQYFKTKKKRFWRAS